MVSRIKQKVPFFVLFLLVLVVSLNNFNDPSLGVSRDKIDESFTKTIEEKLEDKSRVEKNSIKADEIKQKVKPKKTKRSKFDIEILELNKIENGVEVFVRAWNKNGEQIGFGSDGSVDVERFLIYNPPVLVNDPNGDILRIQEANIIVGIPYTEIRLREDPEEALLQTIEHNLSVMENIHIGSKIERNKRGNTTSTFYPDPDPESTSVDGHILHSQGAGTGVSWSTLRNAAGNIAQDNVTIISASYLRARANPNYNLFSRGAFGFDTSSLGSDTIDSATFSIYGTNKASTQNLTINVVSLSLTSNTSLANGDYAISNFGGTKFATGKTYSSWNTSGYNDFTLNASGEGHINGSGVTVFGTLSEEEIDDSEPTHPNISGVTSFVQGYNADQTGTSNDPKLVVEHTGGGGGAAGKGYFFLFN